MKTSPSNLYKPAHGGFLPKDYVFIAVGFYRSSPLPAKEFTKDWLSRFDPEECFDAKSLAVKDDCNCVDCGGTENFHSPNCEFMREIAGYPEDFAPKPLYQPISNTPYDDQKSAICSRCNIYRVGGVCEQCGSTC
jgi:hypothetical protein